MLQTVISHLSTWWCSILKISHIPFIHTKWFHRIVFKAFCISPKRKPSICSLSCIPNIYCMQLYLKLLVLRCTHDQGDELPASLSWDMQRAYPALAAGHDSMSLCLAHKCSLWVSGACAMVNKSLQRKMMCIICVSSIAPYHGKQQVPVPGHFSSLLKDIWVILVTWTTSIIQSRQLVTLVSSKAAGRVYGINKACT